MRTSELTRSFRLVNRILGVSAPIFLVVAILLRDANEAVLQMLGLAWLLLTFAVFLLLDERYRRRHERDQ